MAPDVIFFDTHRFEIYEDHVEVVDAETKETVAVHHSQDGLDNYIKNQMEVMA
jgi:hypothetical protein